MVEYVLVLNAGSSSIKFAGYLLAHDRGGQSQVEPSCFFTGVIDDKGEAGAVDFKVECANAAALSCQQTIAELSFQPIFDWLEQQSNWHLQAVGHRVVHGGEAFHEPSLINAEVIAAIENCNGFAPLHNPANLRGIRACQQRYPDLPQVAVFDTAFHQSLSKLQYLYPLPYEWYQQHGVRRYGFHGTSHEYVTLKASELLGKAPGEGGFISLHLGNGCSAAAVFNGKSLDTSMGLTPLEGMMMGTRSGDMDPGLAQFLCATLNLGIDELTNAFNKKSGLLGVSGLSSDMRRLQAAADEGHEQAQLAIDLFCWRAAKAVASMRVVLPALDAIIFTGGIGEHAAAVRAQIVEHLGWLGCQLDAKRNAQQGRDSGGSISLAHQPATAPTLLVVNTDEEQMIARHVLGKL